MQQQCSKRGTMGVLVMLIAVSVGVSAQAASKATTTCQCQAATTMAPRADTAAHPVSLGTGFVARIEQTPNYPQGLLF